MSLAVKICGVTRSADAVLAARLGATWIGFVFWPRSPRFVEPAVAATILAELPPHIIGVGVFVDQSVDHVNAISDRVGLGAVQLHGHETVNDCTRCRRRVIRAVRLASDSTTEMLDSVWANATVLVDVFDPVRMGGTGRQVDWGLAAQIARRRRTLLSGGLRPDNVAEAVRRVAPYGLDVSSGVESAPGVKDSEQMQAFFRAVAQTEGHESAPERVTAVSPATEQHQ